MDELTDFMLPSTSPAVDGFGASLGSARDTRGLLIVVTGYPKSGNTWISNLVADAIGCPMEGFWGSGAGRVEPESLLVSLSPHCVYKAHHTPRQIGLDGDPDPSLKVIHVVRDPRDVVCSGAAFFQSKRPRFVHAHPEQHQASAPEAMTYALLHGTQSYPCCDLPWADFNREYLRDDVLRVRYEDFLADPQRGLEKILSFLGLQVDAGRMSDALERNSFHVARQRALERGQAGMLLLMRQGKAGSYREQLPVELISRIEAGCRDMMEAYGYRPDCVEDTEVISALKQLMPVPAPVQLRRLGGQAAEYCLIPDDLEDISYWFSTTALAPSDLFVRELGELHQIEAVADQPGGDYILHCDVVEFRPDLLSRARIVVLNLDDLALSLDAEAFIRVVKPVLDALAADFGCIHLRCHRIGVALEVPGFDAVVPSALQATFLRRDRWCRDDRRFPPMLPHPLELVPERGAHPQMILDRRWCPGVAQSLESFCKQQEYQISILRATPAPLTKPGRSRLPPRAVETPSEAVVQWLHAQCQKLSQRSVLHSDELTLNAPSPELQRELASGKPFRLSSAYKGFLREGVVVESDPFFFHTAVMHVPAITVDLEVEYTLQRLVVENRSDTCFSRARLLFCVVHQEELFSLDEGLPLQGTGGLFSSAGSVASETELYGLRGRYLTLFSPEKTALHLRAIRVYGT